MRNASTLALFFAILAMTIASIIIVWPSTPTRYLPGDFWPEGRGISIGSFERETMRLGLDLQGGAHLVLEADPPENYEGDLDQALDVARDVIQRRIDAFGVAEAEIQKASGNRLDVQVPGMSLEDAQDLIGRTAQLRYMVIDDQGELVPATGVVDGQTLAMSGQYLKNNTEPLRIGINFAVRFETTGPGPELMRQITSRALQYPEGDPRRLLNVYLDDELISSATVQGVISNEGFITGLQSFTEASNLSKRLNAGALPVPLRTIQANEVSATLGDDSVKASVNAAEIGLIAVIMFMILYYRLPGLLAAGALVTYATLVIAVFKLWPITLTLSGIAAFILSVGMAVDANILIFERMKEELRRGRPLNSAIDIGFRRAWPSIRDSNVSTFITCGILFWFGDQFGASFVKGFALTLAIGVAVSMFSAITVTRTYLKMIVGSRFARSAWLFNAEETRSTTTGPETAQPARRGPWMINFAKARFLTIGISAVAVVAALVILAFPPALKAGIEFTGGSTFTIEFSERVDQGDLRSALSEMGYPEARVQGAGTNTYLIRTRELAGAPPITGEYGPLPPGEIDEIMAGLEDRFGDLERLDFATVSGTVSSEIARDATLAIIAAAVAILLYIWFAFRRVPRPWLYGTCAVIALAHDALIVLGLFSLLGKTVGTEVDTPFVVAMLTVIGFSVHDTIVVFDRIRENISHDPYLPFEEAVNMSLTETLARSINTSFVTILTIVAMFLIGGVTIRGFLLVLLVGVTAGTYSSIGVAAQTLITIQRGDIGGFFRRIRGGRPSPAELEPA
ncbi:MAG: protein translocase subunit SecDF [Dehalococcoidia bacterium]